MTGGGCLEEKVGLVLLCSALSVSLCFNIIVFLRRLSSKDHLGSLRISGAKRPTTVGRNEDGERIEVENLLYGNSRAESGATGVCYSTIQQLRASPSKLNYASLDLEVLNKYRGGIPNKPPPPLPLPPPVPPRTTHPANYPLEPDVTFNCIDGRGSVYINHKQLAKQRSQLSSWI